MNILVITGDRSFKKGNPRFDMQAGAVQYMESVYCGVQRVVPQVLGNAFDVVTTQDPFFRGLIGLFLAKKFRATFNVQVHADINAQSVLKRLIASFVLRRADSIRVVSEKLKKEVEGIGVRGKITVLPIFIETERFKNIQRTPALRPTLLWVGRFEKEKDPRYAITVLKDVRSSGVDAALIMLGSGSLLKQLKETARELPVQFPGWTDPVPFLTSAHVVLSTSYAESWGASIVEALLAGVPVVAPNVGVAQEAGAIVVAKQELAHAVVEVLKNQPQGRLTFAVLSKEAWLAEWLKTLS